MNRSDFVPCSPTSGIRAGPEVLAQPAGRGAQSDRIHSILEFTYFVGGRASLPSPGWSQCFKPSVPASWDKCRACRHVPLYLTLLCLKLWTFVLWLWQFCFNIMLIWLWIYPISLGSVSFVISLYKVFINTILTISRKQWQKSSYLPRPTCPLPHRD